MRFLEKVPLNMFKFGTGSFYNPYQRYTILPLFLLYRFAKRFKNRIECTLSLVWVAHTKGMVWVRVLTHTKEWLKTAFLIPCTGTVCPYQRPIPKVQIYGLERVPPYIYKGVPYKLLNLI